MLWGCEIRSPTRGPEPSKGPRPSCYRLRSARLLDDGDVLRLHPLLAPGRLVGDLGALLQRLETPAGYRAVVNEEVVSSLVRGDEAVALLAIEPLYRSLGHVMKPTFLYLGLHNNKRRPTCRAALQRYYKPTFDCIRTIPD